MRKVAGGLSLLTALVISVSAAPQNTNESPKRTVIASTYDVSKEVTLEGTIQSLVRQPAPGEIPGARLVVSTAQGMVDAHIGNRMITGPHAESFAAGQAVKLVGIMTKFNQQDVLLVRTIETENRTITVRNEHGFLVFPGSKASLTGVASTGGVR